MKLPMWMRGAMLATAAMNVLGAATFLPGAATLRSMGGFPEGTHPFYLATVAVFILIFGCAYLWSGLTGCADRQFIAVAAGGKLAFFALLVWFWVKGSLPALAPVSGIGDLAFGLLFAGYLVARRRDPQGAR